MVSTIGSNAVERGCSNWQWECLKDNLLRATLSAAQWTARFGERPLQKTRAHGGRTRGHKTEGFLSDTRANVDCSNTTLTDREIRAQRIGAAEGK